jgi:hypothetical protein
MRSFYTITSSILKGRALAIVVALLPGLLFAQTGGGMNQLPAAGTTVTLGKVDNITIEGKVQSPSSQATPLQVVCVFEYTEGDIFNSPPALPPAANGLFHIDQALHGLITDLRKRGKFMGRALETLLITPPEGTIPLVLLRPMLSKELSRHMKRRCT